MSMDALPSWIDPEAWAGFCAMRVKIKKPLTDRAKRMLLKRLTEMHSKGHDVNACLEQSEFKCWDDVYELKEKSISRTQGTAVDETKRYLDEQSGRATKPTPEQRALLESIKSGGILKRVS